MTETGDGPEEFQWLLYCYLCDRRLNDPDDPSTAEALPHTCARCAELLAAAG